MSKPRRESCFQTNRPSGRPNTVLTFDSAKKAAAAEAAKEVAPTPPVSGLKRGETPQQYVARTITLDLGDF